MSEGFIFYQSFTEALRDIPAEQFKAVVLAVSDYAIKGVIPEDLDVMSNAIFTLIKPQIDANAKRREAGRKGGEAKGKQTEANVKQTEANSKQPVAKEKVKVKEKEKVKDNTPEVAIATMDMPENVRSRMQSFADMRKNIKKPMTANAVKLMYDRLQKLSKDPDIQCQILDQSIRNCWQDVYELKDRSTSKNAFTRGVMTSTEHEDQYADYIRNIERGAV